MVGASAFATPVRSAASIASVGVHAAIRRLMFVMRTDERGHAKRIERTFIFTDKDT